MIGDKLLDVGRRHGTALLAVAAVLCIVGAYSLSSSYHAVEQSSHRADVERWSENATYTYSVTVVRNSTLWPNGTILPMGMPAYYRTISDGIDVKFAWDAHDASGVAAADMLLRVRAESRDGRVFWEIEHPLAQTFVQNVSEGIQLGGRVDLDALHAELEQVGREMPLGDGSVNLTIETTIAYAIDAAGVEEVAKSRYYFPLEIHEPRVVVPQPKDVAWRVPHANERTWVSETQAGWDGAMTDLRGLALLGAGAVLLLVLVWVLTFDPIARLAPRDARYVQEHAQHRDWITTVSGKLDVGSFPSTVVDVTTLESLVETASDARCRILHDPQRRVYYAVLPHATYRYARHARAI